MITIPCDTKENTILELEENYFFGIVPFIEKAKDGEKIIFISTESAPEIFSDLID